MLETSISRVKVELSIVLPRLVQAYIVGGVPDDSYRRRSVAKCVKPEQCSMNMALHMLLNVYYLQLQDNCSHIMLSQSIIAQKVFTQTIN